MDGTAGGWPLLVVVAGRPGTGKTTLARSLASVLGAAYLRVDAIETALRVSSGAEVAGYEGYAVAHQLARSNLELGRHVVADAVCPVPEARSAWAATARSTEALSTVLETVLPDVGEHRRRVEQRRPDMPGQRVPRWHEVENDGYAPWDEERDGVRLRVETTSSEQAVAAALRHLQQVVSEAPRRSPPPDRPGG